jgi:hypothetical protein
MPAQPCLWAEELSKMTGAELKAWRERCGYSPLIAADALGIELWQLAAYEAGQIPIPPYIERLTAEPANRRED